MCSNWCCPPSLSLVVVILDKMPFQQYAKYVGAQGKSINTLVTEVRLDSDSDTPKLTFKPVKYLTEQEWEIAKEKGDTPAARSAVMQTAAATDGVKANTPADESCSGSS
jgi:Pyruvate/2-oxoacid:ferredoxin oxidoreductase gamma subunit